MYQGDIIAVMGTRLPVVVSLTSTVELCCVLTFVGVRCNSSVTLLLSDNTEDSLTEDIITAVARYIVACATRRRFSCHSCISVSHCLSLSTYYSMEYEWMEMEWSFMPRCTRTQPKTRGARASFVLVDNKNATWDLLQQISRKHRNPETMQIFRVFCDVSHLQFWFWRARISLNSKVEYFPALDSNVEFKKGF